MHDSNHKRKANNVTVTAHRMLIKIKALIYKEKSYAVSTHADIGLQT